MTAENCDWQDHPDIMRWTDEWRFTVKHKSLDFNGKDDPLDELRHRLSRGDFVGKNKKSVESFLAEQETKGYRVSDQAKADREERAVAAAERSADASERSADASRRSSKWAGWAIFVSIAALLVAAWPYVKVLFESSEDGAFRTPTVGTLPPSSAAPASVAPATSIPRPLKAVSSSRP